MTRSPRSTLPMAATLATALLMPLILNLAPPSASSLPNPVAATATAGLSAGQHT